MYADASLKLRGVGVGGGGGGGGLGCVREACAIFSMP